MLSAYVNKSQKWIDLLLIFGKPIYPYWYLYVLVLFYLLLNIGRVRKCGLLIIPFLLMISSVSRYVNTHDWFQVQHLLFYAVFFYSGFLWMGREVEYSMWQIIISIILTASSVALLVAFWNQNEFICNIPIVSTIVAAGVSISIIKIFKNIKPLSKSRSLNYIGRHSLEIYVIHCFFTAANRVVLVKLGINNVYCSIAINTVISTVIPLIFAYTVGKTGLYDLFFRPINLIWKRKTEV